MSRLFVFDAMGLAYRAHYAFIRRPLVNSRGEHTSTLFGFANSVLKIRREEQPEYWALAWDGPGPTHRHERYPEYKAHRKPMPPELLSQIPALEDLAQALGLPVLEVPGAEADDVMATLAVRGAHDGHDVALVTSDKDMLQLVGDRVRLLSPTGRDEYTWVDAAAVHDKWGVAPEQIRDVLALMGDASDNVPGVHGVGQKTAVELIGRFGSLDALYAKLDEVPRKTLREKLSAHRDDAFLSRELVTVRTDCDLPPDWEALRCGPVRREELHALAQRFELQRLERVAETLGVAAAEAGPPPQGRDPERRGTAAETPAPGVKLASPEPPESASSGGTASGPPKLEPPRDAAPGPETPAAAPPPPPSPAPSFGRAATAPPRATRPAPPERIQASLDLWSAPAAAAAAAGGHRALAARLHAVRARAFHGLALLPVSAGDDPRRARLVGLALAARDGTTCYVPLGHESGPNVTYQQARDWLSAALEDPNVPKVGEDLKRDAHVLGGARFGIDGFAFDVHLGSFLCDPERDHGLPALARDFLGEAITPIEPPRGAGRTGLAVLPPETVGPAAERAAGLLFPLADTLTAQLEARAQRDLYDTLEHPLIVVLLAMERTGVLVDRARLEAMGERAGAEIGRLEEELYRLAGERFNLNSGPQLSRILFEKLGLETGRRTKTGYSTDQAVLESLAGRHAFPARLLEYRALAKLKSTYLDALPGEIDPADGRVHTTFNQAGAATGRLSSSNPNLQNIPMRSPQGREIRRAFVAPPGRVLVGADYSQIELRLMAHLSEDPALIEAFRSGEDVHANTARRIFGIPPGPLDPALRARAKVVNFGVMYGMGARSLAEQMDIPLAEARDFIGHYFGAFARVRDYLDASLDQARRRGWVETLLGRRRYLPALMEGGGARRAFAERAAINAPIQGSAADLMKLAMVRVHAALKRSCPSARLLLQVHDELLLECPAEHAATVASLVRAEMEGCYTLRVPLEVSVGQGPTWFDVH